MCGRMRARYFNLDVGRLVVGILWEWLNHESQRRLGVGFLIWLVMNLYYSCSAVLDLKKNVNVANFKGSSTLICLL